MIDNEKYIFFDQKELIEDKFKVSYQNEVSNVRNPCCSICYYVIENIDKLLELYNSKRYNEYNDLYINIIINGANRKKCNNIHDDGEFLDDESIKRDFNDIYKRYKYHLYLTKESDINTILLKAKINTCIIINRSYEIFIIVKLVSNYLLIDSHQQYHGILSNDNVIKYITLNNLYNGFIEIGIDDSS